MKPILFVSSAMMKKAGILSAVKYSSQTTLSSPQG
jgi:hypothetical protein